MKKLYGLLRECFKINLFAFKWLTCLIFQRKVAEFDSLPDEVIKNDHQTVSGAGGLTTITGTGFGHKTQYLLP